MSIVTVGGGGFLNGLCKAAVAGGAAYVGSRMADEPGAAIGGIAGTVWTPC